jgi:hypothetical protein
MGMIVGREMGFIVGHTRVAFRAELAVERFRRLARGFGFGSWVLKAALIPTLAKKM